MALSHSGALLSVGASSTLSPRLHCPQVTAAVMNICSLEVVRKRDGILQEEQGAFTVDVNATLTVYVGPGTNGAVVKVCSRPLMICSTGFACKCLA